MEANVDCKSDGGQMVSEGQDAVSPEAIGHCSIPIFPSRLSKGSLSGVTVDDAQSLVKDVNDGLDQSHAEHGKQQSCQVCGKSFPTATRLKFHMFCHSDETPFICQECGEAFSRPDVLKRHQRTHIGIRKFACTECPALFKDSDNLKTHMRIHTGAKPYKCEFCEMAFTYSSSLKSHRFTHTGQSPHQCTECGASFTRSVTLRRHMRVHSDKKLVPCGQCGKTFKDVSTLKRHMLIHSSDKPFACTDCSASFSSTKELKSHTLVHMVEKPFKCVLCGICFAHASALRTHTRIHTGQRPHICGECGASFSQAGNLTHHKRVHEGDTLHACEKCGARFGQLCSLTRHMNTMHSSDTFYDDGSTAAELSLPSDSDSNSFGSTFHAQKINQTSSSNQSGKFGLSLTSDMHIQSCLDAVKSATQAVFSCSQTETNLAKADSDNNVEGPHKIDNITLGPKTIGNASDENGMIKASFKSESDDFGDVTGKLKSGSIHHGKETGFKNCEPGTQSISKPPSTASSNVQAGAELGAFLCLECGLSFSDSELLQNHVQTHSGKMLFTCEDCALIFTSNRSLESHRLTHVGKKISDSADSGALFSKSHPAETLTRIGYFPGSAGRSRKVSSVTVTGRRILSCGKCGETFRDKIALKRHMRVHTDHKPFTCGQCCQSFTHSSALESHKITHERSGDVDVAKNQLGKYDHSLHIQQSESCLNESDSVNTGSGAESQIQPVDRHFSCPECEETFAGSERLQEHMEMHSSIRLYSCRECGVSFRESCHLRQHMKVHTTLKPFACCECTSFFTCAQDLKRHMRTHTGERPLRCKVCDASFAHYSSLKQHMLVHSGQRPYTCELCGDTFAKSGNLNKHKLIHTGDPLYTCKQCGVPFNQTSSLTRHMTVKHNVEKPRRKRDKRKSGYSDTSDTSNPTEISQSLLFQSYFGAMYAATLNTLAHVAPGTINTSSGRMHEGVNSSSMDSQDHYISVTKQETGAGIEEKTDLESDHEEVKSDTVMNSIVCQDSREESEVCFYPEMKLDPQTDM